MPTVIDTLHNSAVTENLSDTEIRSIAGIFEIKGYKSGETVVLSETETYDNSPFVYSGEWQYQSKNSL
jgi:hypothetical protein